jgi:hypothetical protein
MDPVRRGREARRRRRRRRAIAAAGVAGLFAVIGIGAAIRIGAQRQAEIGVSGATMSAQRCLDTYSGADMPSHAWLLISRACADIARNPDSPRARCILEHRDAVVATMTIDIVARECGAADWLAGGD